MTAFTRAGTLSLVMMSWGGTSMVTVLRSTLTILSMEGRRMKSPGPLGPPLTRPSLKITPRSYSLTTLMALIRIPATKTTIITTTMAEKPKAAACNKPKFACMEDPPLVLVHRAEGPARRRPFDGHHLHHPSAAEPYHRHLASYLYHRLPISRIGLLRGESQHRPPPLAVHEHPPLRLHPHGASDCANLADHPFPAGHGRPPPKGTRRAQNPEEHAPHEHSDDRDGSEQHPRVGNAGQQERKSPGEEGHNGPRRGQAVVGHAQVHEKQREPDEHQDH